MVHPWRMTDEERAALLPHLGRDEAERGDPVAPPIVTSSMYHLPGAAEGARGYGRVDNPTWEHLERALTHLEDAPSLAFPSGMAAICAALAVTLDAGDRLVLPSDGYYATRLLASRFLGGLGIEVEERATSRMAEGDLTGVSVVFAESPSNPGLDLCDLTALSCQTRAAGARLIVDNTTMTPFGQRPLNLGADIVVAADTKAPGGHSDLLMGHAATRDGDMMEALKDWRRLSGSIPGPFEAFLAHRGLETLELRLSRMWATARAIAPRLAAHPAVEAIRYPGLPGDPAHELAARQMRAPGFLIGVTLASEAAAERFLACPLLTPATSFGGIHSSAERRARWGDAVPEGFVRLSVGCEPEAPLWAALEAALDAAARA